MNNLEQYLQAKSINESKTKLQKELQQWIEENILTPEQITNNDKVRENIKKGNE